MFRKITTSGTIPPAHVVKNLLHLTSASYKGVKLHILEMKDKFSPKFISNLFPMQENLFPERFANI